jgi:MFS transporter, Spinster family, sphingosine-1-phosphate transporter
VRGRVLTQTIGLAVAAPFLFLVGYTDSRWVLLPYLLLFGLGRGFFDCNLMPVVCQIVSEKLRATAYGVLNFTSCLAGGAMAVAGGALKDTIGLGGALQLSAAMLMIAAFGCGRCVSPTAKTSLARRWDDGDPVVSRDYESVPGLLPTTN